jgi:hypothetical protein
MIGHASQVEAAGCYFDAVRYPQGAPLTSGTTRLHRERGIWIEAGESQE